MRVVHAQPEHVLLRISSNVQKAADIDSYKRDARFALEERIDRGVFGRYGFEHEANIMAEPYLSRTGLAEQCLRLAYSIWIARIDDFGAGQNESCHAPRGSAFEGTEGLRQQQQILPEQQSQDERHGHIEKPLVTIDVTEAVTARDGCNNICVQEMSDRRICPSPSVARTFREQVREKCRAQQVSDVIALPWFFRKSYIDQGQLPLASLDAHVIEDRFTTVIE